MYYHKGDIGTLEELIPYELDLYMDMIVDDLKKQSQDKGGDGGYSDYAKEVLLNKSKLVKR